MVTKFLVRMVYFSLEHKFLLILPVYRKKRQVHG